MRILLMLTIVTAAALVGCAGPAAESKNSGATPDVRIAGSLFSPATLRVAAGATVTWTNDDQYQHTVTADDAQAWGTSGSGDAPAEWLASGASWTHAFATPGTYGYHCALHATQDPATGAWSGQVGTVVVT